MKKGFTLLELSVVLVIIGILIGGLVVGRSLLRSSNIQAGIADLQKFAGAANTFYEKFQYYPGDFPDATEYWEVTAATSGEIQGDGNGLVDNSIATTPATDEAQAFWLHLTRAGLIQGNYTGTSPIVAGTNAPKLPNGLIGNPTFNYYYVKSAAAWNPFHGATETVNNLNYALAIPGQSPGNAYAIDVKVDDGLPLTGSSRANGLCCTGGGTNNVYSNSTSTVDTCVLEYYAHSFTNAAWTSCN